jgi:Leucine-rich repeat (LRR) protein
MQMIQNVEGLHMAGSHCNYDMVTTLDMTNIRLLHMNGCKNLDYIYKKLKNASKLRWMQIRMSLGENEGEKIEELLPSFFIPFKQLRILEMESFVHLQHVPFEIGILRMLEHLTLIHCEALEFISETLGNLTSLVTLDLSQCPSLKALPKTLGKLTLLVTLKLDGCLSLRKYRRHWAT